MVVEIQIASEGFNAHYDITEQIASVLPKFETSEGIAKVLAVGSTVGLISMRYEEGAVEDLLAALERISPREHDYAHYRTSNDLNGFAHVWSSIMGSSVLVPYKNSRLAVSHTHRIVLFDFDLQPAPRTIFISN
ncbi:YjbQ family protein [Paenibacillus sp. GCM10012307]|uniref:YjbQ family protein n=1 Tax=Paenibacillus roseus TaxID=2798579 RepID=A0A934JAF6_9BACL|nr:YjbQ family protein [Paenibacillus roseus]MBJ6363223.1 YjbQ family protein [Paenibacillus roseus]